MDIFWNHTNVLAYKRVNNIYPRSPCSMLFPGVCKFTRLCFDHVTTLTTLKWGRGVENISYGTLNKWKFGKVSQEFCPRLKLHFTLNFEHFRLRDDSFVFQNSNEPVPKCTCSLNACLHLE